MMAKKPLNEQGVAAILVTMVIMVVIGLTVTAFATIIRREQRQALDRHLESQAYYVAESGINMLTSALNQGATIVDNQSDCSNAANPAYPNVDFGTGVKVTCMLVDSTLPTIELQSVGENSTVVPLRTGSGANFNDLTITWQDTDGGSNLSGGCAFPNFPPSQDWQCDLGILRIDLVPTGGNLTRAGLLNNTFTSFLYPSSSGGANTAYTTGQPAQGNVFSTNCVGSPAVCTVRITNLASAASSQFYIRLRTVYGSSNVIIRGTDTGNNAVDFVGAQLQLDVTGKAQDVLRRVRVRATAGVRNELIPGYGLESGSSLCKRYRVIPGSEVFLESGDAATAECSIN